VRAGVGIGCMAAALGGGRGSGVVVQPGDESRAVQRVTLVHWCSFAACAGRPVRPKSCGMRLWLPDTRENRGTCCPVALGAGGCSVRWMWGEGVILGMSGCVW
jgi:hypothetical protein